MILSYKRSVCARSIQIKSRSSIWKEMMKVSNSYLTSVQICQISYNTIKKKYLRCHLHWISIINSMFCEFQMKFCLFQANVNSRNNKMVMLISVFYFRSLQTIFIMYFYPFFLWYCKYFIHKIKILKYCFSFKKETKSRVKTNYIYDSFSEK